LKTLEKINRKAIIKSLEKGKPISAQLGPLSPTPRAPAPARPWCLTGGPRLSAPTSAPSLPLSLAAPWARLVGAVLSHARAPASLSVSPTPLSARPQPPAHDPSSWTRPHPRTRAPFEPCGLLAHLPSLICALCQTLSPSLSLYPRVQGAPPPSAVNRCLFCGHRRVCAPSSATVSSASLLVARGTFRCALSLSISSGPRSLEQSSRSRSPVAVAPSSPCASVVASRLQPGPTLSPCSRGDGRGPNI
jgi:hypothetical protein